MDGWRVKQVVNLVNGSTLLGLAVARAGRASCARGPRGLVLAHGYRLKVPVASAFTIGNVVTTQHGPTFLTDRPRLLAHEERHTWQYVACLGVPMLPLYLLSSAWSYVRGGDFSTYNAFERLAGLEDGSYATVSRRTRRREARARRRAGESGDRAQAV